MEFLKIIFGEYSISAWAGYCTVFLLGVLIQYLMRTRNRSFKKEVSWSWDYFLKDNWRKFLLLTLLMWAIIRFYLDVSPYLEEMLPTSYKLTSAFGITVLGLISQKVINWISTKLGFMKYKPTPLEYANKKANK